MSDEPSWQQLYDLAFPRVIEPDGGPEEALHAPIACKDAESPQVSGLQADPGAKLGSQEPLMGKIIELRPRCTATSKQTGERCKRRPHPGANVCVMHGAGAAQVRDKAAQRVQEQQALALARKMVGEVDLATYADPFEALSFVQAYSYAFAERMAKVVEAIPDSQLRYEGKLGEQLRGEVAAMQRALSDSARITTDALKLGLAERRQRLEERQLSVLEHAVTMALESTGLDLHAVDQARKILRRELYKAEGVVITDAS